MAKRSVKDKKSRECGLMMPIAAMISQSGNPYSAEYWKSVREFLDEAVEEADMKLVPAWQDDKYGVIHARIIENIKTMEVMIGVIIGYNANVMLECGMRLWTNKPILLIAEDDANIPFDIKPIQCLLFPKDREYSKMKQLKKDIVETLKAMVRPDYVPFKSHFNVEPSTEVSDDVSKIELAQFMVDTKNELQSLRAQIESIKQGIDSDNSWQTYLPGLSAVSIDSNISSKYNSYRPKSRNIQVELPLAGSNGSKIKEVCDASRMS